MNIYFRKRNSKNDGFELGKVMCANFLNWKKEDFEGFYDGLKEGFKWVFDDFFEYLAGFGYQLRIS